MKKKNERKPRRENWRKRGRKKEKNEKKKRAVEGIDAVPCKLTCESGFVRELFSFLVERH
jgi:cytochrome c5